MLLDALPIVGLATTTLLGVAGWFWKFSIDRPDSTRKELTTAGKVALGATFVVAAISVYTLAKQQLAAQTSELAGRLREKELQTQISRLQEPFDVSRVELRYRVPNSNPNLARFLGHGPIARAKRVLKEGATSEETNALLPIVLLTSHFDMLLSASSDASSPKVDRYVVGGADGESSAPFATVDWWVEVDATPKNLNRNDGWTIVRIALLGRPIRAVRGAMLPASFLDLSGRELEIRSLVDGAVLERFVLYSARGKAYPLLDPASRPTDTPLALTGPGKRKLIVPSWTAATAPNAQ